MSLCHQALVSFLDLDRTGKMGIENFFFQDLVSFLDIDETGKMRIEDFCTLLLRCNRARTRPRTAGFMTYAPCYSDASMKMHRH